MSLERLESTTYVWSFKSGEINPFLNNYEVERIIFQPPYTIVVWKNKTKTVVKCGEMDSFDPEVGFAMALAKKVFGERGKYLSLIEKAQWQLPE